MTTPTTTARGIAGDPEQRTRSVRRRGTTSSCPHEPERREGSRVTPADYERRAIRVERPGGKLVRTYFIHRTALKPYGVWVRYVGKPDDGATLLKGHDDLELALCHLTALTRNLGECSITIIPNPGIGDRHDR